MPTIEPDVFRAAIAQKGLNQSDVARRLELQPANITIWLGNHFVPDVHQTRLDRLLGNSWRRLGAAAASDGESSAATEVSPFGLWLARVRAQKGFSALELANEAGVTPATVYNIESGRSQNPQKVTRDALIRVLGANPDKEILDKTEQAELVAGLGVLIDFDPQRRDDLPQVSVVYIIYDELGRISYVGQTAKLRDRMTQHWHNLLWFKSEQLANFARYIEMDQEPTRRQFESLLIKVANPIFNKYGKD